MPALDDRLCDVIEKLAAHAFAALRTAGDPAAQRPHLFAIGRIFSELASTDCRDVTAWIYHWSNAADAPACFDRWRAGAALGPDDLAKALAALLWGCCCGVHDRTRPSDGMLCVWPISGDPAHPHVEMPIATARVRLASAGGGSGPAGPHAQVIDFPATTCDHSRMWRTFATCPSD